jgi:hypothetical protein
MKNITLNIVLLMALFTFIGCEQSPISPITETNYSVTVGERQTENIVVNKSTDSVRVVIDCLNLTRDQHIRIMIIVTEYENMIIWLKAKQKKTTPTINEMYKSIRIILSPEQQILWDNWVATGTIPCEIKPDIYKQQTVSK